MLQEKEEMRQEKEEMRQEFEANSREYEREISNLHESVQKEQSKAENFRDAMMHAEDRVEEFMKKIATLQTELDSKTELSQGYKERLDKSHNYAMKVKMEAEMKVKELERTLQEKDSALENLKQDLREASEAALNLVEASEIEEMQRDVELLNMQKMQKEEEASNARADLLAQQMVNAALLEEKQDLDGKYRELRQHAMTRESYVNSVKQKNIQETEEKLKETQNNYETMKQTFQNTAKENIELKRELSETVQIEHAAKDEVKRLTALANELENRLAEADNHALRTTETLEKVKEEARIEAMKIVSETKERAKQAESLLMKERTESAVTYSALELQVGSLEEKLTATQSEYEEREARAVEQVREDFHYQMRALEEKVLIAEAATRDAEMRAEALQQLAEKAEDDSARTFDAAVKAVTEATNTNAAADVPPPVSDAQPSSSSSTDLPKTTTKKKTPLSKMRKADLVAACEAMNLDAAGTVPVLRARLRDANY